MPSLDTYKKQLGSPKTIGEAHKLESDKVMEWTWYNDIESRIGYLYDMYNDFNPYQLKDMKSNISKNKIPIEIKYIQNSSQTYEKDAITYHIMFKPSQRCNVPYYKEYLKIYNQEWPLGLYIDIEDDKEIWNRWLIVAKANGEAPQFPTYEILKCDYSFEYIIDNTKQVVAGVLRSQNSYNSGVWQDYKVESVEDQQKFIVPLNRETEKLYYDQRMIVDARVLTEPRTWRITKVNRLSPNGLVRITLAQDRFNHHTDYIEKDIDGNVIGFWANYFDNGDVTPIDPIIPSSNIYSLISYSGMNPNIKAGGSYKKFTVTFYDDNEVTEFRNGTWTFTIDGVDVSDKITTLGPAESMDVAINQIKAKLEADNSLIGKILLVGFESDDGIKSETEVNIQGF